MTSNGWNPKKITAGMKLKKTARPPGAAVHQDQVRGVQRNSVACVCVCETQEISFDYTDYTRFPKKSTMRMEGKMHLKMYFPIEIFGDFQPAMLVDWRVSLTLCWHS